MSPAEAFQAFATCPRPSRLPPSPVVEIDTPDGRQEVELDLWPCFMAGAALLSGLLPVCRTLPDLLLAVVVFHDALRDGRVTMHDWHQAAQEAARSLQWAERLSATASVN